MTETDQNHAMEVARWTCLAAIAKEGLSTKGMLRRADGALRYGLELDIKRKLTVCAAQNVRFLNDEIPTLINNPSVTELICVAETIGNQVAAKWVADFDEAMDAGELGTTELHLVAGAE
jgi:hypothetical protein